jgi:hypothetical protein
MTQRQEENASMTRNIQPDNNQMFQESEAVKERKVELEKLRRRSLATSQGKLIHSNRRHASRRYIVVVVVVVADTGVVLIEAHTDALILTTKYFNILFIHP